MNEADKLLVEQITTKPWRDGSLVGASIQESTVPGRRAKDKPVLHVSVDLAWVERGEVADEYNCTLAGNHEPEELQEYAREIVAFSRGAIPVGWGTHAKSVLVSFLKKRRDMLEGVDTTLCFLLRPKSRWLDPSIWSRVRTGHWHPFDKIREKVGVVKSHSMAIDVAALAYQLPTREQFPVKPDWTASATADWQELQRVF